MLHLANSKHVNLNSFFEPIVYLEINNRKQVFLYAKLELELDCSNQLIKHHHGDNRLEQFGKTIGLFPFDRKECVIELISCEYNYSILFTIYYLFMCVVI